MLPTVHLGSYGAAWYNGAVENRSLASAIRARIPGVELGVPLAPYTTFRLGGPAEFFLNAETEEEVARALHFCREFGLPLTVLGGGSNVVIADAGVRGLVLLVAVHGVERRGNTLRVGAGENFQRLTAWATKQGLSGLEFGVGIYGNIGGAVAGNSGAFGSSMATVSDAVDVVDATGEIRIYPSAECGFAYRQSRFPREGAVVVRADLRVLPADPKQIAATTAAYLATKRARQPLGSRCAGCIFRNYHATLPRDAHLLERFTGVAKGTEVPAGALIQEVGLGGERVGGIQVSELHGNFFVNDGSGTAEQVVILMSRAQTRVRDAFGVQLHPEVRLLGFTP